MSDWWTQPQQTPGRSASAFYSPARASTSSRARFVSDDPDPGAGDAPKFLPSFVSSPARQLPLGTSPNSVASPPAPKRSPTARFSTSLNESASSPRNIRTRPVPMDEDMIPTSSLHDSAPERVDPEPAAPSPALATPPSLEPASDTTALHVFGPPAEYLAALRPYLEAIGPVASYEPGPDGSNWWIVTYATPLAASYALRRHGEIVSGRWMLGFKVAGPGSTQGLTLVNGVGPTTPTSPTALGGVGTPMTIQSTNILKPKPKAPIVTADYAWDEQDTQSSGVLSRAAEFIFGR